MTTRAKILALVGVLAIGGAVLADPNVLGQTIILQRLAFASFPAASATNEGGVIYDSTGKFLRNSNATEWNPVGSGNGAVSFGCGNFVTACAVGTNYGGIYQTVAAGGKFRNITCVWRTPGTAGSLVLRIRNLTDATTLCTCTLGSCAGAAFTPQSCDCNTAFLAAKNYTLQIDATTSCGTLPAAQNCFVGTEP